MTLELTDRELDDNIVTEEEKVSLKRLADSDLPVAEYAEDILEGLEDG